ncbi:nitric oxide associated protein 1 [Homalodisca vitripennis]|nr:nitric oxide associated protein 1 [Homalodisca vitripennis]
MKRGISMIHLAGNLYNLSSRGCHLQPKELLDAIGFICEIGESMGLKIIDIQKDMADYGDKEGPKRPLIVVGNKIDLLQDFKIKWLEKAKEALVKQLPQRANILHTALVSAKTGYGIEQLITALYKLWEYRGDVYLVGCTNVGKSTLFNALLQSDYCKTKAVDLIQRATTAPWPGTTLNLLKTQKKVTFYSVIIGSTRGKLVVIEPSSSKK